MGKKEKERYGNQIWKNIITKWKHLTFPHTHFKNLKFAWFSLVQKINMSSVQLIYTVPFLL